MRTGALPWPEEPLRLGVLAAPLVRVRTGLEGAEAAAGAARLALVAVRTAATGAPAAALAAGVAPPPARGGAPAAA